MERDADRSKYQLQWGRNLPVAEIRLRPRAAGRELDCFNGAATFQSRKWVYAEVLG